MADTANTPAAWSAPDSYAALSPAARLVAQAYGVVAPNGLGVQRAARILSGAEVRLLGRSLTQADVRDANGELIEAGVAFRPAPPGVGVCASPRWAVFLAEMARHEGRLERIVAAFDATRRQPGGDRYLFETRWRCYVIGGDYDRLDAMLEQYGQTVDGWRFLAEPLAVDVLERLPARYVDVALAACLREVIDTAAPPEPVIAACRRLGARPEVHAADIAFIRVLQGRFDAAEAVFADLPADARESRPARTGLASTEALTAMLRGDHGAASQHVEAAIAQEKAGTRKRNVFPEHAAFALSLLALARLDTPESRVLLERLVRTAERRNLHRDAEVSLAADARRVLAGDGLYLRNPPMPCFEGLLDGFRTCWLGPGRRAPDAPLWPNHDMDGVDRAARRVELLDAYRRRADANAFAWVSAECAATLWRLTEWQDETPRPPGLPDPEPLHAALGTCSLTVLVEPVPPWERSLKALEQLAYDAKSRSEDARAPARPVEKRLVWEIETGYYDIELRPREQRRNRNGKWSKGRKVALRRLSEEAASMEFLREEDRAAAAAISVHSGWRGLEYVLGARGLHALAGHPHVYNESGEPVEVVRREPELHVDAAPGGLVAVRIEPHGWDTEGEYGVDLASDHRVEVTRFTADHRRLFEVVPPEGLELPAEGRSRLLEAVSALVSQVRVQSSAGPVSSVTEVDADPEPWVRLEPFEQGLSAALLVEPIPGSDNCFAPGEGGITVLAVRDGEHVQAQRDLDAERRAVAGLVAECPALASRPTEYAPLMLPEVVASLELLEQVEASGARCKWPRGEPFRIVARHSTPSLSLSVRTAEQWLEASGELAVDDDTVLDLKRLVALLEANPGSRFLELGSGEFLALTRAFRRQLDDFASLAAPGAKGAMRVHSLAATSLDGLLDDARVVADDGWRQLREDFETARSFEPQLPSTLRAELRPYQVDGFRWLARLSRLRAGACLADDMGLGKTVQTLAVLLQRAPGGPALVVAPTSVVANWVEEARRFAPTLNVRLYTGPAAARTRLLDGPGPFDLYVTTYGLMQNDIERLAEVPWHSAVLDEAQAIKNPATRRARAARRLVADFRIVTTGTPIQNHLTDLYSLFSFLNPGLLGSQQKFRERFAEPVERDGDEQARARLRRIIAPFVLRRLKADVLDDLPERTEVTLHVTLSPEEAALYETLRQRAVEQLESARTAAPSDREGARFQLFAHLTRLRLACCNPRLVVDNPAGAPRSSKLRTFAETLDELLENRHKVLVFSQFVMHLKLVEEYLVERGVAYQYLDGSTPAKVRTERIAAFQAGTGDVFLISLKAGGTGLNLTAADYVIHLDPWWNPAVEDQASDRAHRIGQTRPVTVYRLVAEGTIEEQIVELHRDKRDLAERLLEGADAAAGLSTEQLLELLREPLGIERGNVSDTNP